MEKQLLSQLEEKSTDKSARVQAEGQVLVPPEMLKAHGIKEGDFVLFTETSAGILITSRKQEMIKAVEEMARVLRESGVTLEDLIESGLEIREEIAREKYPFLFDK